MLFLVDIQTAVAAKEALEGHSIYEGGYCKLHLAFSRHTELNVKVIVLFFDYNKICCCQWCFVLHSC